MKQKLFTLLTLLLCAVSTTWADVNYYTPEADEVIILSDVYSASATTTGYSTHEALVWYSNQAKWATKKAGDPNNGGAQTSSTVSCFQTKNNGDTKRIDVNISGVKSLIVYRESSANKLKLLDKNDSSSEIANDGGNCLYHEFTLDGTKNYSIRLEGNDGTNQQDVNVYAIKLIKYGTSKQPSDLTITSGTTLLLEKNETSSITHTTSSSGAINYSSADEDVATVTSAGVITAKGGGKTKITVSQASDNTYAAGSKVVDVNVPYDNPAAADTYTLTSPELSFSNAAQTKHYFTNGFTMTTNAEDGMQYANIENSTGIKYSHVRTYTINTPSNVTATYLEIKARNNYPTGGATANWGTVLGTDYSAEILPFADEEPQTKYFQIETPTAGANLTFSPGGNQWQGYITVHTNAWVAATGVSLNKTSSSIEAGQTETLTATIAPANATNQNVTWTSSDENVATVANGVVTGIAEGTATITATTEDGSFTATCDVTVTAVVEPIVTLPTDTRDGYSSSTESTNISGSDYAMNGRKAYSVSNGGSFTITIPATTIVSKIKVIGTSADNSNASTVTITGVSGESTSQEMNLRKATSITEFEFVPTTQTTTYTIQSTNKGSYLQIAIYGEELVLTPKKQYTTLTSAYNLDFTNVDGLNAYIVKANGVSNSSVTLTQVNKVPAGTGIILKGTANTKYTLTTYEDNGDDVTGNLLKGSPTEATTPETNAAYILSDGAFHPWNGSGDIAAGKAYLNANIVAGAKALAINFADETGINDATVNEATDADDSKMYNTSGQLVGESYKGIVIVNGKKVIK